MSRPIVWDSPPSPADAYWALEAYWRWPENRNKRSMMRGIRVLQTLVQDPLPDTVRIYAQTETDDNDRFWYKVYFLTRAGTLKRDTTGEHLETQAFARFVIKSQGLQAVTLDALMANWQAHILWVDHSPISAMVLHR
jgi:S-adenosylmethionine:tRNA-ribosyltransferase-isomerase (queuine synthetase)